MITIRKEQMEAFAKAAQRRFSFEAADYVKNKWPQKYEKASRDVLVEIVNQAIEKCKEYDITQKRHVLRYLKLMNTLGRNFDTWYEYPWAPEILNDPQLLSSEKLEELEIKSQEISQEV